MLSSFRNRFGIPGVISVVALVFAMFGGAYAANDSGDNATASAKTKKGPKGPKGAKGDTGPAGPTGPAGAQGSAGAQGPQGEKGDKGDVGSQGGKGDKGDTGDTGKSVEVGSEPTGTAQCEGSGGVTVQVQGVPLSKKYVCNGKDAEAGEGGLPATLPPGATLTGSWAVAGGLFEGTKKALIPISFPIPLADTGTPGVLPVPNYRIMKVSEAAQPGCTGGTTSNPKADPGFICIYTAEGSLGNQAAGAPGPLVLATGAPGLGASQTGAYIRTEELSNFAEDGEAETVYGTWAVTAPVPGP